jgi:hypothetical protein
MGRGLWREKLVMPDGAIIELVIWRLSVPTFDRPHGLKYRLYYGSPEGVFGALRQ